MKQERLLELAGITEAAPRSSTTEQRAVDSKQFAKLQGILQQMHKIVNPGEYGLGSEKESVPDNDKAAWERLGKLLDKAQAIVK